MHSQVGTHDAVPVFYHAAGPYRLTPGMEQLGSDDTPTRVKAFHQFIEVGSQDVPTLPGLGNQMHRPGPQLSDRLLLERIKSTRKQEQMGQGDTYLFADRM